MKVFTVILCSYVHLIPEKVQCLCGMKPVTNIEVTSSLSVICLLKLGKIFFED